MKISVIGTGYVGLVLGTCLAESGNSVICIDNDDKKIQTLKSGKATIYEPGLQELLERNVKENRLFFSPNISDAVENSEIIFLSLPTPPNEDGSADLRHILGVAKQIAELIQEKKIIVLKSTVPIGTNANVADIFARQTSIAVSIVSNPEFQKQGTAVQDFMSPDRVIVGTRDPYAAMIMKEIYAPFMRTSDRFILMDERSAELTKYAANSFLAMKISFINEIANLCEVTGADVDMVRKGMGSDPRVGRQFLFPGIGYGGSCFPKDVKALIQTSLDHQYEFKILEAVDAINENQKKKLVQKVKKYFHNNLADKKIAIWGLAYKPKTDDMREAPSIITINGLLELGAKISAYDPAAKDGAKEINSSDILFTQNSYLPLEDADALLIITEWNEFRHPDFVMMKKLMKNPIIFDGRNIYDPELIRKYGFTYFGIGRPDEQVHGAALD